MFVEDELIDGYDSEAIQYLINHELEGAAAGIAKQVLRSGLYDLTEKQQIVFDRVIKPRLNAECEICGRVEPTEVIGVWANEGYCGRCAHRMSKD